MGLIFDHDDVWSIGISCAIIYAGLIGAYAFAGRNLARKAEPQASSA